MQRAARVQRVFYSSHARLEMKQEDFSEADVTRCLLTGSIVEDQFDERYQQTKYIWLGEATDGRELSLVTRLTYHNGVYVVTVFWSELTDYE